jgi:tetrahydromethanopterin S-methyltransferase subunit F
MDVPITGYLLIPLGLIIAILPWRYCLIGLMVFAMMSPAAVINYGKFGLQPGYYLSILLSARTVAEIVIGGFRLNGFVLGRMKLLFYFSILVFVVLFIALCFFQGKIEVLPGTSGFKSAATRFFHLSRENFTQVAYLILNIALVYTMGHQGARRAAGVLLRDWDVAVTCGLCFAAAIALWQFVSLYAGLYFPSAFFYTNAGYNRADSQSMVGLFRINGCFEEPSTLGYTFTGYVLFAWLRYRLFPTAFSVGLIAVSVFCMLVSTSTTAIVGLLVFACIAFYDVASSRLHLFTKDFRLSSGQVAAIALFVVGGLAAGFVVAANWQAIHLILQSAVFRKSQSSSFQERMFADVLALRVFVETYGIGVGLGSDKANSLMLGLLSNTGIIGLLLLGGFVFSVVRPIRTTLDRLSSETLRKAVRPFQWGAIGLILIHGFSNPNLSVLTIWVFLGGLIATQASVRKMEAAQASRPALGGVNAPGGGPAPLISSGGASLGFGGTAGGGPPRLPALAHAVADGE